MSDAVLRLPVPFLHSEPRPPAATSEGSMLTEFMQRSRHVQRALHGGSVKHTVKHTSSHIHVTHSQAATAS